MDVDRYVVRITPERLQPDRGLSVIVTIMQGGHVVGSISLRLTDA